MLVAGREAAGASASASVLAGWASCSGVTTLPAKLRLGRRKERQQQPSSIGLQRHVTLAPACSGVFSRRRGKRHTGYATVSPQCIAEPAGDNSSSGKISRFIKFVSTGGRSRARVAITSAVVVPDAEPEAVSPPANMATAINMATVVERATEYMIPSTYRELGGALSASPAQLGTLTCCGTVVASLVAPLCGIAGDKFDRRLLLGGSCIAFAALTAVFGRYVTSYPPAVGIVCLTAIALSLAIASIQSLTADMHPPETRGQAFGTMQLVANIGGVTGGFFTMNLASSTIMGMPGWRFAFQVIALASAATGVYVLGHVVDPRHTGAAVKAQQHSKSSSTDVSWQDLKAIFSLPTFWVIVAQGCIGCIAWNAMVFYTLLFQHVGFSDLRVSMLLAAFNFGNAAGCYFGGLIGDWAGRHWSNTGRIAAGQFSVVAGIPFSFILLRMLPQEPSAFPLYALTLFSMGCFITWAGTACNAPLFAEVVPAQLRSTVYGFDRALEGVVAAMGAPLVGFVAENVYGYTTKANVAGAVSALNARALSESLFLCSWLPWLLCALLFTGLYWTYPADRLRALEWESSRFGKKED
eukprot:jgi/Chlat1/2609/Chrsp178S02460